MKNLFCIYLLVFTVACAEKRDVSDNDEHNPKTLPSYDAEENAGVMEPSKKTFGDKIIKEGAIPANTVSTLMQNQDSLNLKIIGEVKEVCQVKGCWMMINLGGDEEMRVTFRDYEFFVPKNIEGRTAIVEGTLKRETTDVATLRHYAEDAGKNSDEIAAIVNPEESLVFVADGVILD